MSLTPCGIKNKRHSQNDRHAYSLIEETYESSPLRVLDKLEAFPRFSSKRSIARFLCKYEIYKKILDINGIIIECGVFNGAGFFSWAQFATIFEPVNYTRKIVGFDTFEGFPSMTEPDKTDDCTYGTGDVSGDSYENMTKSIDKYNSERHLSHIPNTELIAGDFMVTGEKYLQNNPHTIVALLYLDFDLYEPTKKALELFLPRMGRGGIICFDELNCPDFPGETAAMLESLNIHNYRISRFPTDPWISYLEI